jgi:hypothetical protein
MALPAVDGHMGRLQDVRTMARRWNSHKNDAGSLLASVFIITLGTGGCLFTVAAMSPRSILGGVIVLFISFVIFQRFGRAPKADLGFLFSSRRNKRDDGLSDYTPRIPRHQAAGEAASKRPITAEEAHEIQISSANTWVPASGRKHRER